MTFPDPLMTKSDVAALLRCCERTVERQVKLQAFPPPQRFGKESLWFQSIVHEWLDKRRDQQRQWVGQQQSDAATAPAHVPSDAEALPATAPAQSVPKKSRGKAWAGAAQAEALFRQSSS